MTYSVHHTEDTILVLANSKTSKYTIQFSNSLFINIQRLISLHIPYQNILDDIYVIKSTNKDNQMH